MYLDSKGICICNTFTCNTYIISYTLTYIQKIQKKSVVNRYKAHTDHKTARRTKEEAKQEQQERQGIKGQGCSRTIGGSKRMFKQFQKSGCERYLS